MEKNKYKTIQDLSTLQPDELLLNHYRRCRLVCLWTSTFYRVKKSVRAHWMKYKLVVVLEHGNPNIQRLATLTEEHETEQTKL